MDEEIKIRMRFVGNDDVTLLRWYVGATEFYEYGYLASFTDPR